MAPVVQERVEAAIISIAGPAVCNKNSPCQQLNSEKSLVDKNFTIYIYIYIYITEFVIITKIYCRIDALDVTSYKMLLLHR